MKDPRQQHYIPRFYLSGFVDPDVLDRDKKEVLWVYERGKSVRRSSPEKEARQRDYYTFMQGDARNTEIEAWLGNIETLAAPIISELALHPRQVTNLEKQVLAVFIGIMQMRTPSGRYVADNHTEPLASKLMKAEAADPLKFRAFAEDNGFLPGPDDQFDLEEIRQDILAGRDDELAKRDDHKLLSIVEVGKMVAEVLLNMAWQTIFSGEVESFLVSDDPVISHVIDPKSNLLHLRMGAGTPGVNVWFPLSRSICLRLVKGEESGFATWVPAGIRYVNKMTIMCADRWVYASERSDKIKSLFDKRGGTFGARTADLHFEGQRY